MKSSLPRLSLLSSLSLAAALLALPLAHGQPSGGPYGPIEQTYVVPAGAARVHYVAPDGNPEAAGSTLAAPTTLGAAIARAATGDAIILRGGTYRVGGLRLNQGITIQPHADEKPVLKGTEVATQWESLRDGVWRTAWKTLFPTRPADWWRKEREGMRTPLHRFNNDMVFVDGRPLQSADWEGGLDENSYSVDYERGYVYIKQDPANRLIEITARDNALTRTTADVHGRKSDRKGYTIRGLTFTQYAYRALEIEGTEPEGPADPATYGKEVVGSTLEHVTITHCSRVAGYFRGDGFTVRHCLISDTSTEGIYIISSSDCLLERNIFARNNVEKITGYYPSAVKIFNQSHRVVCRDNLVIDQANSNGIWYDVGNNDGVFVNNWVQDCYDGFFFEISTNAICAGNVFVNCDKGVRILNAAGARIHHNTFLNAPAWIERTERSAVNDHFGWHPATGPDVDQRERHVVAGNLFLADATFAKPLLRFEQSAKLRGQLTTPQPAQLDGNVYVRPAAATATNLIAWSPAGDLQQAQYATPQALHQAHPQFEKNSRLLRREVGSVVHSVDLKNFELVADLPATAPLPEDIRKLLGWTEADAKTAGAYPKR